MITEKSYAQILKASSIMGGAAGICLLLGMVRVKFAAVFIGTTGVGLNASFTAIQSLLGNIAGLGIQSSGVRDIATAFGKGDTDAIGRAVLVLRRICWVTGVVGMVAMMLASPMLSQLTFGHQNYSLDIAALGLVILFGNLASGQLAIIQGMRRIGDMARANIIGAVFGTVAAIGIYATLGLRGIIPTLVAVSAFQFALSWYFARKLPVPKVKLTLQQTFVEANSLVRLGFVFMANGLMASAVAYVTVALITQYEGTQAVGIYSAAYALSGMFVNFVLSAMGADYFPRLTAAVGNKEVICRMANEQTEIGLLLALPGLLATLALAPWILKLFYTHEFLGAVELQQWFILGCLGRVISWPLGHVILALGKGKLFLLTETSTNILHISLIAAGLHLFALEGVAVSFCVIYLLYILAVYLVCRNLIGFSWSSACRRNALFGLLALGASFVACRSLSIYSATVVGLIITLLVSWLCLQQLALLLGPEHRVIRMIMSFAVAKRLLASRR